MLLFSFFFFFQAEDGIRDLTVTGVQTCALPIYQVAISLVGNDPRVVRIEDGRWALAPDAGSSPALRSEEHTSELQSQSNLVCRLLLEKKNNAVILTPLTSLRALYIAIIIVVPVH